MLLIARTNLSCYHARGCYQHRSRTTVFILHIIPQISLPSQCIPLFVCWMRRWPVLDASLSAIALPGIVMFPESDRSLDELVYQDKLFFQEWRQPAPSQLACEQELERLLKMFIGGMRQGKRLEQPTDTECTELAEKIIPLFVQAEALGQQFARKQGTIQTQEAFTDWLKRASDLVERVIEWAKQLFGSKVEDLGDDATGDELEQAISDVADT